MHQINRRQEISFESNPKSSVLLRLQLIETYFCTRRMQKYHRIQSKAKLLSYIAVKHRSHLVVVEIEITDTF